MIGSDKISDLEIERFVMQELGTGRAAVIERQRETDPVLAARIALVFASNEEILNNYPPKQIAARIREVTSTSKKAEHARMPMFAILSAAGAASIAAVLTMVWLSDGNTPTTNEVVTSGGDPTEQIRLKGPSDPSLFVYRKGESGEERLLPGQTASQGDVIQLKYSAKGAKYGVIFSIDGRGTVTLHYPGGAETPSTLDAGGTHALDFSYELDDAPDFERFFFVTAHHPIDFKAVIEKAKTEKPGAEGRLSLDPSLSQCDFVLKKTR